MKIEDIIKAIKDSQKECRKDAIRCEDVTIQLELHQRILCLEKAIKIIERYLDYYLNKKATQKEMKK